LQAGTVRATYGAVAGLLGVPPVGVGAMLGEKRHLASWVVSKSTGLPTGYLPTECHPMLTSKAHIIETVSELRNFMKLSRGC
jgi:alkylated DNA nucleotide flippase Atl1